MGNITDVLSALKCENCSKYVCNSMTLHSECCKCFKFDLETEEVEVSDDISETTCDIDNCFNYHHKT